MMLKPLLALAVVAAAGITALAQTSQPSAEPSDAAKALVGAWELSNPDRDRRCQGRIRRDQCRCERRGCKPTAEAARQPLAEGADSHFFAVVFPLASLAVAPA